MREQGSWRIDDTNAVAEFRYVPDGAGELVERLLGRPEEDPELWESVLIEEMLRDPAMAGLRSLRLCLTDFHHSARRAAVALAGRRWERLTDLWFGHEYEYLYQPAITSTGRRIDPLDRLHEGFVGDAGDAMWAALPNLRTLTVEGALLFDRVVSPSLTSLRLRGVVGSDGSVWPGPLPALRSLELDIQSDVYGVECPVTQLEWLTVRDYPALRSLDLRRAAFDVSDGGVLEILAANPIVAQLERLRVADLDEAVPDGFEHLELTVGAPLDGE
ncbi:hypothetical protein AMIS_28720 [Actinoplanes missouriensis 431]|uniref:Leucine-rich repeat domain-containing protein n=1 Tax=Actinoplanes missouriensis (strain ATCC 14538 / DSM 43046 / CBS 188.64 / JCM 3121 / NBRC 102363 / NCIMB 12654 / NRRL B-3342 / UNCC 431) TaxID=512565 RepID=I0H505_ACTM4|nr:hypothetical protein [Actinoplanes missouriensis]BAL88092.1 hypothetical protein AMIS_28720 [Actinoplanes missouriensis 431]